MSKGHEELIGEELLEFACKEANALLSRQVCKPCGADECDGCPGIDILTELENQVGREGVEYMRRLIGAWGVKKSMERLTEIV